MIPEKGQKLFRKKGGIFQVSESELLFVQLELGRALVDDVNGVIPRRCASPPLCHVPHTLLRAGKLLPTTRLQSKGDWRISIRFVNALNFIFMNTKFYLTIYLGQH